MDVQIGRGFLLHYEKGPLFWKKKQSFRLASRKLYQGQATHLSGKGTKATGDKAQRHEERLFPWGVLGEARPKLLLKPSNERSLSGGLQRIRGPGGRTLTSALQSRLIPA